MSNSSRRRPLAYSDLILPTLLVVMDGDLSLALRPNTMTGVSLA